MSKPSVITIDITSFAHLWDTADTASMRFTDVSNAMQEGEDADEIDRLLTSGSNAADYVRQVMQNIAEEHGISTQDMQDELF